MSTLGFDNYVEPLKLYLQKYREGTKGDKQGSEGFEDLGEDVLSKSCQALLRINPKQIPVFFNQRPGKF